MRVSDSIYEEFPIEDQEDCENCGVILTPENKAYYNREQGVGACIECVENGEAPPAGLYHSLD